MRIPVAAALALLSTLPAKAQTYACAPWDAPGPLPTISEIMVSKRMMTLKENGLNRTARMAQGSLEKRIFLDEEAVLVVYGKPVFGGGEPPRFGDRVILQRLHLDETAPVLAQTACKRLK